MTEDNTKRQDVEISDGEIKSDFEILHYSINQDGHWEEKMVQNWGAKDIIATQTWIIVQERIESARQEVLNGTLSPIGYYIVKCIMDPKLCGQCVGLSTWRVKRHMRPRNFRKLSQQKLQRYADAFQITIEELSQLEERLKNETKNDN